MNLPTKITVFRIVLAPLFFVVYFIPEWMDGRFAAETIYLLIPLMIVMEFSDVLDGHIARKRNLVTDLGKILDPFSDVMSRITFFFCFTATGLMPLPFFLIILYRELGITFLRMYMMGRGTAMAASIWGKMKAVTYTLAAAAGIVLVALERLALTDDQTLSGLTLLAQFVFLLAVLASVGSFVTYAINVRRAAREEA